MDKLSIPYSKVSAVWILLFLSFLSLFLFRAIRTLYFNNNKNWVILLFFEFILLSVFIWSLIKRIIPSLKGTIVLTISDEGICYYPDNITVKWPEITKIEMRNVRSSFLSISLKNRTIGGVIIPLQWVAGTDKVVYEVVNEYWQHYKDSNNPI